MDHPPHHALRADLAYPDAEVVLGLVYAVGTDYSGILLTLQNYVRRFGYEPNVIRLSESIPEILRRVNLGFTLDATNEGTRLNTMMTAGNKLCEQAEDESFIASAAVARISKQRKGVGQQLEQGPLPKTAHILLSLKRPGEVELLRAIYGPGFYLIGVFASEIERLQYLTRDKNVPWRDAWRLMKRDQDEHVPYGQRSRDAFQLADVFIRLKADDYKEQLERFLDLAFGSPFDTPTPDEQAMFLAYAASLRSGQLGRQVGAAIRSANGDILALGCNDVPTAGGGLYWPGPLDMRDHILGFDSNDREQIEIVKDLRARLGLSRSLEEVRVLLKGSRVADITEYGRAVHAEMDALLSCARIAVSPVGGTLLTTTFPCHNCTRHIIAAGIEKVVYIEPYPKSMATKLHKDAIELPGTREFKTRDGRRRVPFEPFVGVGPRRFFDLFSMRMGSGYPIERKDEEGGRVKWRRSRGTPRIQMLPTSYIQREKVAGARFVSQIDGMKGGLQ